MFFFAIRYQPVFNELLQHYTTVFTQPELLQVMKKFVATLYILVILVLLALLFFLCCLSCGTCSILRRGAKGDEWGRVYNRDHRKLYFFHEKKYTSSKNVEKIRARFCQKIQILTENDKNLEKSYNNLEKGPEKLIRQESIRKYKKPCEKSKKKQSLQKSCLTENLKRKQILDKKPKKNSTQIFKRIFNKSHCAKLKR